MKKSFLICLLFVLATYEGWSANSELSLRGFSFQYNFIQGIEEYKIIQKGETNLRYSNHLQRNNAKLRAEEIDIVLKANSSLCQFPSFSSKGCNDYFYVTCNREKQKKCVTDENSDSLKTIIRNLNEIVSQTERKK